MAELREGGGERVPKEEMAEGGFEGIPMPMGEWGRGKRWTE